MIRGCVAVLLLSSATLAVADDTAPQPRIIDSNSDRVPVQTTIPIYPRKARRDRVEGEVRVCFEVTREGRTRGVAVRSSTHRVFEKPSIKAVRASSFKPLHEGETQSPAKLCRTFVFALEPVEG